jgi:uncharacterized integral membrane protein
VRRIDTSKVRIPGTHLQGWQAIIVGALALYILLFIILNDRKLEVDFIVFSVRSNELLALIVILALGFATGFIVRGRQRVAGPGKAEPPALEAGAEPPALVTGAEPATPEHPEQGIPVGHNDTSAGSS